MHKFLLLGPIFTLAACSNSGQLPYQGAAHHSGYQASQYGQYNYSCNSGTCAPGQSYSVGDTSAHYQNYNQGNGPVHVYPNPYGYGGAASQYAGGQYGAAQYGYPQLRDAHQQRRGGIYGTLGAVMYDTDINNFGLEGRLGYDTGRIIGAEIEGSIGVINDNETADGISTSAGFGYNAAVFAVARAPISQRMSLHARAGYDFRNLKVSAVDTVGGSANLDGFAYGVGGEYALTPRDGLRLDLTRYDNQFGAAESISASYTRKF